MATARGQQFMPMIQMYTVIQDFTEGKLVSL